MISGNCNRSPQYNVTMGPPNGGTPKYGPQVFVHHQQQQHQQQHPPQWMFMAGANIGGFSQPMSRGFSMMPSRGGSAGGSHPTTVFQCTMHHQFGNGFGYHPNATAAPAMFHQQHQHIYQQPQVIHHQQIQQPHQQQPQFVPQQQYIAPSPANSNSEPSSGFINGIKNMVKGIIHPLNCDFYTDHHKSYNPKYRNNYMRDLKSETICYQTPQSQLQPDQHVKSIIIDLEMNNKSASKTSTDQQTKPPKESPINIMPEVVAIFKSEDFPELPAPGKSRSLTPPKTETKTSASSPASKPCQTVTENVPVDDKESSPRKNPPPKGTFFEITIKTSPSGRRPTFGGRFKVVPPPFSLNTKSLWNSSKTNSSATNKNNSNNNNNKDCDSDEDSFVIFSNSNEKFGECGSMFATSFGNCRPPRQRQISECSDDSFVVFFTEDADCSGELRCANESDDDDDDDDLEELYGDFDDETSSEEEDDEDEEDCCDGSDDDDEDDDDDDDDGVDVVDSSFLSRNTKTDRNKINGESADLTTTTTSMLPRIQCEAAVPSELKQYDSGFDEKKVTFDPQPVVHVMHTWNYAYRAARKGHWEDCARDRNRFQQRIERTSVYLNPILTPEHRNKIYQSRFVDETDNAKPSHSQCKNLPKQKISGSQHEQTSSGSCNDESQTLPKLTELPDCASF